MFEEMIFLATYGSSSGTTLGNLFDQWSAAGVFSHILPFLILFALVFGILTKMKLFQENRAINPIIAAVVALMSLQFPFVPEFFSEIFPRVGIGIVIILAILIIAGLFLDPENKGMNWFLVAVAAVIVGFVVFKSITAMGWSLGGGMFGTWWMQNGSMVVGGIILIALVAIIVASTNPQKKGLPQISPIIWKQ